MDIKSIVLDLCAYDDEQEWFEFKEPWMVWEIERWNLMTKGM